MDHELAGAQALQVSNWLCQNRTAVHAAVADESSRQNAEPMNHHQALRGGEPPLSVNCTVLSVALHDWYNCRLTTLLRFQSSERIQFETPLGPSGPPPGIRCREAHWLRPHQPRRGHSKLVGLQPDRRHDVALALHRRRRIALQRKLSSIQTLGSRSDMYLRANMHQEGKFCGCQYHRC